MANVVKHSQVKLDELSQVIGNIPHEMRLTYPTQVEALETLREEMLFHAGVNDGFRIGTALAWEAGNSPGVVDLSDLRAEMRKLPYDRIIGRDDDKERDRIAKRYDKTLAAAEDLLDQHAFMALRGNEHTLNSSALSVPLELPGPVVLDATAGVDLMYDLMEDPCRHHPYPRGVRDYSNLTIHVARTERIGKTAMEELAAPRFAALQENLPQRLGPERQVLFVVHKRVEHLVPTAGELKVKAVSATHWGAVDGRNEFKDYDTAVIMGFPFRDHVWAPMFSLRSKGAE
ncbi:hypothetical protein IVA79_31575 [Bradyrhizobium sp. 138]|uniref:hypothetical protein n=1 Tax=Bradyrhizobium sp. 138 TaxID=2782615 RepID=UPI001FF96C01|nr:hypothetical protein [Bradyrhizobium sp. 138]MCK1738394.1 hypothetical protein [Bradyrhizobium sp. 138]